MPHTDHSGYGGSGRRISPTRSDGNRSRGRGRGRWGEPIVRIGERQRVDLAGHGGQVLKDRSRAALANQVEILGSLEGQIGARGRAAESSVDDIDIGGRGPAGQ